MGHPERFRMQVHPGQDNAGFCFQNCCINHVLHGTVLLCLARLTVTTQRGVGLDFRCRAEMLA